MSSFLSFMRSFALLIARVALGGILVVHGWDRWQVRKISSQVTYLQHFGTPYPEWAAWGATILELVGGIFLIVGALTPLVALAVVVEQVLIICYVNWRNGPSLISSDNRYVGGYEYNVALGALALLLAVYGAGALSVDRLFRRSKPTEDEEDDYPVGRSPRSSYQSGSGPRPVPAGGQSSTTTTLPTASTPAPQQPAGSGAGHPF